MIGTSDNKTYDNHYDYAAGREAGGEHLDTRTPPPLPIVPNPGSIAPHNPNPPGGGPYEVQPGQKLSGGEEWDNRKKPPSVPWLDPKLGSTPVLAPILPFNPMHHEGLPKLKPGEKLGEGEGGTQVAENIPLPQRRQPYFERMPSEVQEGMEDFTSTSPGAWHREWGPGHFKSPSEILTPEENPKPPRQYNMPLKKPGNLGGWKGGVNDQGIPLMEGEPPSTKRLFDEADHPYSTGAGERRSELAGTQYAMMDDPNKKNVIDFPAGRVRGEGSGGSGGKAPAEVIQHPVVKAQAEKTEQVIYDVLNNPKGVSADTVRELRKNFPAQFDKAYDRVRADQVKSSKEDVIKSGLSQEHKDLIKFGAKEEDVSKMSVDQAKYARAIVQQKTDKQFGKGAFDKANKLDENVWQGVRDRGNFKAEMEKQTKIINDEFDKTIKELHEKFPDLPPLEKIPNMSTSEKVWFYSAVAAALGGSAIAGAVQIKDKLDEIEAKRKKQELHQ